MFALYLDIQKQIYIDDLDEKEMKGRWKSFVGKWYDKVSALPSFMSPIGGRVYTGVLIMVTEY